MADFIDNIVEKMETVEPTAVERVFLNTGSSVLKIDGMLCIESQKGQNFCILEATVYSSDSYAPGTAVKQMWALSNTDKWMIEKNLGLIKAVIQAAKPNTPMSSDVMRAAILGGANSSLVGHFIKATMIMKESKNGKPYPAWSYVKVDKKPEEPQLMQAVDTSAAQMDAAFGGGAASQEAKKDELPDFDM